MASTQTATATRALLAPPSKPATTTPAAALAQRIRPYKDFLTPALHRRFTHAALLALAACYASSAILSPPSWLWFWNPFSLTTLRALVLFIPCLAVFIVRVTNLHFGESTYTSQAEWAWKTATSVIGWHTLVWYLFSAFLFGEVYIASQGNDAGLEWVDKGREYERERANENPIFLRALWLCLAVTQTVLHFSRAEDQVAIPTRDGDPLAKNKAEQEAGKKSYVPNGLIELYAKAPMIGQRVVKLAFPGFAFTLPTYFIVLRRWLWPIFYSFARTFYRGLPPGSTPTGLQHIPTLSWQSITSSLMLITLWEVSNAAFGIYVSRPPIAKSGIDPLTSGTGAGAKDPNGSLLTGLKSKKEVPRNFAFWELSLICAFFEDRRKTIYTEVNQNAKDGSIWSQISTLCIDEIKAVHTRIKDFQTIASPPTKPEPTPSHIMPPQKPEELGMPRIADRGVVPNGAVTANPPKSFERDVGQFAKSVGQSPGAHNPLTPRARKAIEWGAEHGLNRASIENEASGLLAKVLQTPLGEPLRQTFAQRVKAVVFGSPVSRFPTIVFASRALSTLCARSLNEDVYGQVAKSAALIMRTYVETITSIESFVRESKPHWSDVDFVARDRQVKEVQEVVGELRKGLEEVVLTFGEYASSVGVSKKELREARECVAAGGGGGT